MILICTTEHQTTPPSRPPPPDKILAKALQLSVDKRLLNQVEDTQIPATENTAELMVIY